MTLLLLCAGFATRLEPRTINTPKHLLSLGGKKLIDYFVEQIREIEDLFNKKIILTNERYLNKFEKWISKNDLDYQIISDGVSSKEQKLGAIGDLIYGLNSASINDDLFLASPDYIYLNYNFSKMIEVFKKRHASVNIVNIADEEMVRNGSCLKIENDGKVSRFVEKPKVPFSNWHGGPYYIIKKSDLALIREVPKEKYDNVGTIGETLSSKSTLFSAEFCGEVIHLSSEEDYQKAIKLYSD